MNIFVILLSIPLSIVVLFLLLFCLRLLLLKKNIQPSQKEQTTVTIMIAFRNEAVNIENCILSLLSLNYPQNKLQILLGDDNSTDESTDIAKKYAIQHQNIEYFLIHQNIGKAKGKANVLAQLAHQAKSEFLFITDADIEVPENWIHTLLNSFEKDTGMISAATIVKPDSLYNSLQSFEWMYYMAILKVAATNDHALIGIGNNMALRSVAYRDTGGYENIEFSVTEDYKLYKCIMENGWKCKFLFDQNALALSKAVWPIYKLLQQRKRWLTGGKELSKSSWLVMIIHGMFVPFVICLLFINLHIAIVFIFVKYLIQIVFIFTAFYKLKQKINLLTLLIFYEPYFYLMSVLMPIYFFKPGPVKWKGRKY